MQDFSHRVNGLAFLDSFGSFVTERHESADTGLENDRTTVCGYTK